MSTSEHVGVLCGWWRRELNENLCLSERERNRYAKVWDCFDTYLECKENEIFIVFERAELSLRRNQQPGGFVDSFIDDVRKLAESSELKPFKPSLTQDFIVIGVQDNKQMKSQLVETQKMNRERDKEKPPRRYSP